MTRDTIAVIEIDAAGRLHVAPSVLTFPHIYREAMEVNWDAERRSLHSPKPREWSYLRWLKQILAAAREQDGELLLSENTNWLNVDSATKVELLQAWE
jgi:hypothetical protein